MKSSKNIRLKLCPKCRKAGFRAFRVNGVNRPMFFCSGCDHQWTCGFKGGGYLENAMNFKQYRWDKNK